MLKQRCQRGTDMRTTGNRLALTAEEAVLRGDATHAIELRLSKARFKGVVFLRQHRLEEVRATAEVLDPLVILAGQLVLVGGVALELGLLLVGSPLLAAALVPYATHQFTFDHACAQSTKR